MMAERVNVYGVGVRKSARFPNVCHAHVNQMKNRKSERKRGGDNTGGLIPWTVHVDETSCTNDKSASNKVDLFILTVGKDYQRRRL